MTAQQVIDYCAEKERDDVAKFFTLVFEYHVDPGAAFEALMYAQAEGEEVEQVVRDVWHDAGISDIGGNDRLSFGTTAKSPARHPSQGTSPSAAFLSAPGRRFAAATHPRRERR